MNKNAPDVEEQLRAWRQTHDKKIAVSCMGWENIEDNLPVVIPIIGVTLITCLFYTLLPLIGRGKESKQNPGLAHRYATNLAKSRALVVSSRFSPQLFSAFLSVWLLLCSANAVFYLMQMAATNSAWAERVLTTSDGFLNSGIILYILQYWSISSLCIHVLFTSHHYVIGSIASLPAFLVSFYQTASLKGDEVDDLPVGTIKASLLVSFLVTVAFTVPWIKDEYRLAMQEINARTTRTLGYQRKAASLQNKKSA